MGCEGNKWNLNFTYAYHILIMIAFSGSLFNTLIISFINDKYQMSQDYGIVHIIF